ncbi:MAG: glycoside hydrolase family 57 protein [Fimbriimonadales bacterium]
MPVGRFLLCLHSHMPYVLSHGKSPHGTDWLHESAAECYLPILHTLDRLHREGIKPRWTINITPILAEQLADPSFAAGFEGYCQSKIDFAIEDQRKFEIDGPLWMQGLAGMWQRYYTRALVQFKHQWDRNIVEGFKFFQDQGLIEIITCGATHGYLPLLGTDESVEAQVKLGVATHEKHFGRKPRGIWLPECAYRPRYNWKAPVGQAEIPWPRQGVEEVLKDAGIDYFFVDSHMIRGGQPLGTYAAKFPQLAEMFARSSKYFTPPEEFRSEYEHYVLPNGVTIMARDPETTVKVWSGDAGYPGDEYYLEFHKQLYPGRLRYWRISPNKSDLGQKQPYDPYGAFERIGMHAQDLVQTLKGTLAHYRGLADRTGTLVAMYDTELFGHWWWEGPEFLYELARAIHADGQIEPVSGGDLLDEEPARHMITMPEGSWGEGGYHYVWINDGNVWTWEKLYPAERKLRQLARDYDGGPATEIVLQAARELLLAESSDWQFLISTFSARDYAEVRFQDHIDRFNRLASIADLVHKGGSMTADDARFLGDCQEKDAPFADLDLSLWKPEPERIVV